MLLVNHGYDPLQPNALIPDVSNPLIFFKSDSNIMRSIFGDNDNIINNG